MTVSKRYRALDGVRALSMLGILVMHVLVNTNYDLNGYLFTNIIPGFTNLVFLFMMLSAFSMCCGYYDKILNNNISITEFYKKRYMKILPFFIVVCLIDLIVSPSINSFYELIMNITLMFGLLPNCGNIQVIGVAWTLGIIFLFYMLFPFFVYLISSKKKAFLTFIASIFVSLISNKYFGLERTNILYCSPFFVGGVCFTCIKIL